MLHYFNVEIAAKYGMKDAVVLQSLAYWLQKNVINKNNIHDGVAWTFNSVSKMKEYFPYLTYNQLADCLRRLEKNGLIVSANYNKMGYDRTKWYTLTPYAEELTGVKVRTGGGDYGRSRATRKARLAGIKQELADNQQPIMENSTMDDANCSNGLLREQQPIPIIETNIAPVVASNSCANEGTNAENKLNADAVTALGVWKRYRPEIELERPDILGKLYKEMGGFKFTNLVEEASAEGIDDIESLVRLYGEMLRSGDIMKPRGQRKKDRLAVDRFSM